MDTYSEKLHQTLYSQKIAKYEPIGSLYTAISIALFNKYDTYIWGCGMDVDIFIKYLRDDGLQCKAVIDIDENKQGDYVEGIPVIGIDEFQKCNCRNAYVFIYSFVSWPFEDREKQMFSVLYGAGIKNYYIVGSSRYFVANFSSREVLQEEGRRRYYREHEDELIQFMNELKDDMSKDILISYVRCFIECDNYVGKQLESKYKYFFDEDGKELYSHLGDEIWLDLGANYGDSISLYYRNGLSCKKIYAVEGEEKICRKLSENLSLFPEDMRKCVEIVPYYVNGDGRIRKLIQKKKEKITLIKADIEGAELAMLEELKEIIMKSRPVLALCLYHKKEDMVEIPEFIRANLNDYIMILRKYKSWCVIPRERTELVLYAIPKERYIKLNE